VNRKERISLVEEREMGKEKRKKLLKCFESVWNRSNEDKIAKVDI
jgi:hypothetical protein